MSYNRIHRVDQATGKGLNGVKMTHKLDPETKKFIERTSYIMAGALVISAILKYLK